MLLGEIMEKDTEILLSSPYRSVKVLIITLCCKNTKNLGQNKLGGLQDDRHTRSPFGGKDL